MALARLKDPYQQYYGEERCSSCCDENNLCLRVLPVLAVFLLGIWASYVYMFEFCLLVVTSDDSRFIPYLGVYIFLFIYCFVMMLVVMSSRRMEMPDKYFLPSEFFHRLERVDDSSVKYEMLLRFCKDREIRIYTRTITGNIRFCKTCRLVRPDRTHHCSTCQICVIKMDHHCPWVNTCIGFHNYKFFINYILACCLYSVFYFATTIKTCIDFFFYNEQWTPDHLRKINIILCTLTLLVIGIMIFSLFVFHMYLIFTNQTTVETMTPPIFAAPYEVGFNKGCNDNFEEHCTCNPCLWCLPCNTMSGNGIDFDVVRLD